MTILEGQWDIQCRCARLSSAASNRITQDEQQQILISAIHSPIYVTDDTGISR